MEDTGTILQLIETGGTVATLLLFVIMFVRGDIQPKATLEQIERNHEQNIKLMHQIALEAAREVGHQIGKEIAETIIHDVADVIDAKFRAYEIKRDNNRL